MNKNKYNEIAHIVSVRSREMHECLNGDHIHSSTREKLQEQIAWLKHQVNHYAETLDDFALLDRFHWVVDNFNLYLDLPDEEKFDHYPKK